MLKIPTFVTDKIPNRFNNDVDLWWKNLDSSSKLKLLSLWEYEHTKPRISVLIENIVDTYVLIDSSNSNSSDDENTDYYDYIVNHELFDPDYRLYIAAEIGTWSVLYEHGMCHGLKVDERGLFVKRRDDSFNAFTL